MSEWADKWCHQISRSLHDVDHNSLLVAFKEMQFLDDVNALIDFLAKGDDLLSLLRKAMTRE